MRLQSISQFKHLTMAKRLFILSASIIFLSSHSVNAFTKPTRKKTVVIKPLIYENKKVESPELVQESGIFHIGYNFSDEQNIGIFGLHTKAQKNRFSIGFSARFNVHKKNTDGESSLFLTNGYTPGRVERFKDYSLDMFSTFSLAYQLAIFGGIGVGKMGYITDFSKAGSSIQYGWKDKGYVYIPIGVNYGFRCISLLAAVNLPLDNSLPISFNLGIGIRSVN